MYLSVAVLLLALSVATDSHQTSSTEHVSKIFKINSTTVVLVERIDNTTLAESFLHNILETSPSSIVLLSSEMLREHLMPCQTSDSTTSLPDTAKETEPVTTAAPLPVDIQTITMQTSKVEDSSVISNETKSPTEPTQVLSESTSSLASRMTTTMKSSSSTEATMTSNETTAPFDEKMMTWSEMTTTSSEEISASSEKPIASKNETETSNKSSKPSTESAQLVLDLSLATSLKGNSSNDSIKETTPNILKDRQNSKTLIHKLDTTRKPQKISRPSVKTTTESMIETKTTAPTFSDETESQEGAEDMETLAAIRYWRDRYLRADQGSSDQSYTSLPDLLGELVSLGQTIDSLVVPRPRPLMNFWSQIPALANPTNEQSPFNPSNILHAKQSLRNTLKTLIRSANNALQRVEETSPNSPEASSSATAELSQEPVVQLGIVSQVSPLVSTPSPAEALSPGATTVSIPSAEETESATRLSAVSSSSDSALNRTESTTGSPNGTPASSAADEDVQTSTETTLTSATATTINITTISTENLNNDSTAKDEAFVSEPQDCVFWVESGHCDCPSEGCSNWSEYVRKFCSKQCQKKNSSSQASHTHSQLRLLCQESVKAGKISCTPRTAYIPHPTNCHCFYQCRAGLSHLQVCPPGLHFDQRYSTNNCIQPHNAGCPSYVPQP